MTGGYDRARASHLQRQVAEGFGADAGRYDRARPTYPLDLVDRIIAASPGRAGAGHTVSTSGAAPASPPGCSRRLAQDIQQELLGGLGAAVDAAGGTFTMSFTTIAATARSRT